jgi:hypothetical protein
VKRWIPLAVALAALSAAPAARAQDSYSFTVAALGGIGGAFDASGEEQDYDHLAFEAAFGMLTDDRTMFVLRVGRMDLDEALVGDGLDDAELAFLTVAGEYRFQQPAYDFGVYLGLGGYEVSGDAVAGGESDEQALGLAFGLTGDFDVTERFSLVAELSAHYAFLDYPGFYGTAWGGVAFHF